MIKIKEMQDIIQHFYDGCPKIIECDQGWSQLILDCHQELLLIDPQYKILQIKQKFGGLRYYIEPSSPDLSDKLYEITNKYQTLSYTICEITGSDGLLMVKNGYYKTLNHSYISEGFKKVNYD